MGEKATDMKQPGTQGLLRKVALRATSSATRAATRGSVLATRGLVQAIGGLVSALGVLAFILASAALSAICVLSLLYILMTTYQTDQTARFNELHTLWLAEFLGLNSLRDLALLEAAVITFLASLCAVSLKNVFKVYDEYTNSETLPTGMAICSLSIYGTFVAVVVAAIAYVLVLSGMALAGQGQWEIETLQNAQGNDGAPFATKASYALLGLVAGTNPSGILEKVAKIASVLYAADKPQQETSKQ